MPVKLRLTVLLPTACSAYGIDLRYWIEPCTRPETGCQKTDTQLAEWALQAWQAASDGKLHLAKTDRMTEANIRVHWADSGEGKYGETRAFESRRYTRRGGVRDAGFARDGSGHLAVRRRRTLCFGKPSSISLAFMKPAMRWGCRTRPTSPTSCTSLATTRATSASTSAATGASCATGRIS